MKISEFQLYAHRNTVVLTPTLFYLSSKDRLRQDQDFSIQSSTPLRFYKNKSNYAYLPAVDGFASFSILPALPQGLLFDPLTGSISGVPHSILPLSHFTVHALTHNSQSTHQSIILSLLIQGMTLCFLFRHRLPLSLPIRSLFTILISISSEYS